MPVNASLANEVWNRYQYLRDNGHLDYIKKAQKCEDFFVGLQWDPKDLSYLHSVKRPALTINKIISTVSNVLGEQIFNRTDIAFQPRNEGATREVADALTKVFKQISDNNQLPWIRSDVFADGIITSRGFYDVRLDTTDSMRGEVSIEQLNPKNVMIDSDGDTYDPDDWNDVLITRWQSPDDIALLFNRSDADQLRKGLAPGSPYSYDSFDHDRDRFGTPRNVTPTDTTSETENNGTRYIRVIERQYKKLTRMDHFVDLRTGDTRVVPDSWDGEQLAKYMEENPDIAIAKRWGKRIRWTVTAGHIVLHDDWSPYKHFTVVPYFPHFRRGTTIGVVENLLGPQELLNKVSSQELHVVNTTANSGWKVKRNSLQNMSIGELEQRGAQTGLVLELDELTNAEKIQPNQTPTGLDRISYKSEEHIKSISGVSDYQTGSAREDVSAKSVQANQKAGSANFAKVIDNLNRTDYLLARTVLALVQEFYTEERLVIITTDQITSETEELKINEVTPEGRIANDLTLGEYSIIVTSQPERDTFEDNQFDQASAMRKDLGVNIPDKFLIQSSRLRDKAAIIEALEGDKDSPEAKAAAELQQRAEQAEVMDKEASAKERMASAMLKEAKAQTEIAALQAGGEQGAQDAEQSLELRRLDQEMMLERERMEREFALKREQMLGELELKREQAAADKQAQIQTERADKVRAFKQGSNT